MLIKYKSTSCGPQGSFQPGNVREIDQREGEDLVRGGYAEDITPRAAPREQAVVEPVEHAVSPAMPVIPQPQAGRTPPRRGGR